MSRPAEMTHFYDGWADHQKRLLDTLRPLTAEQVQLRACATEWAIWQLASNMAGGRLYWMCHMLRENDRGLSAMFRVDHTSVPGASLDWAGWEDNADRPRDADELIDALEKTWGVIESCLDRWSLDQLSVEVTSKDAWGQMQTITPGCVINRLLTHEVFHGSEIALILRMHGLPTAIAG